MESYQGIVKLKKYEYLNLLMELFGHLSCMNFYKQIFNRQRKMLKQLRILIQKNFDEITNKNALAFGFMQFIINLTVDINQEHYNKQKEERGISQEDFESLEELMRFTNANPTNNIEQYDEKYIQESGIKDYLVQDAKIQSLLVVFYQQKKNIIEREELIFEKSILRILWALSQNKKLSNLLLLKSVLELSINIYRKTKGKKEFVEMNNLCFHFLGKLLSTANPQLIEYSKSMEIIPILCEAISTAKHELAIFEATLALTQLSSMGEQQVSLIISQKMILSTLINNMLDENKYIIQSSLELVNNLSFSDMMQNHFKKEDSKDHVRLLFALFETFYDDLKDRIEKKTLGEMEIYNNPLKKIASAISIMAIHNESQYFQEKIKVKEFQDQLKAVLQYLKEFAGNQIAVDYVLDYIHKIGYMLTNLPNVKKIFKGYCRALLKMKIEDNNKFHKDELALTKINEIKNRLFK